MHRLLSSFLFLFLALTAFSSNGKYATKESAAYILKYRKIAVKNMYQYKVPASVTLAQGILESGSGRSALAVNANNHFGIKCKDDYNGKKYYKRDDKRKECFRSYSSAEDSYTDHSVFLSTRSVYSSLFKLNITDYKGWAKGLKKCGYATNSKYPSLLISIIEDNKLYEYDRNPQKYLDGDPVPDAVDNGDTNETDDSGATELVNGLKCTRVQKGQTLWAISKAYGFSVDEIRSFNEFPDSHILHIGDVVFLEEKKTSNQSVKYHVVESGETVFLISQMYGVKSASLRSMNKIKKSKEPVVGKKLVLH